MFGENEINQKLAENVKLADARIAWRKTAIRWYFIISFAQAGNLLFLALHVYADDEFTEKFLCATLTVLPIMVLILNIKAVLKLTHEIKIHQQIRFDYIRLIEATTVNEVLSLQDQLEASFAKL